MPCLVWSLRLPIPKFMSPPFRRCHRNEFEANHGSVSDMLVKVVLDVQYSLHETLKKDSEFART